MTAFLVKYGPSLDRLVQFVIGLVTAHHQAAQTQAILARNAATAAEGKATAIAVIHAKLTA